MSHDQEVYIVSADDVTSAISTAKAQIKVLKSRLQSHGPLYPNRLIDRRAIRQLYLMIYRLAMLRDAMLLDEPPGHYLH